MHHGFFNGDEESAENSGESGEVPRAQVQVQPERAADVCATSIETTLAPLAPPQQLQDRETVEPNPYRIDPQVAAGAAVKASTAVRDTNNTSDNGPRPEADEHPAPPTWREQLQALKGNRAGLAAICVGLVVVGYKVFGSTDDAGAAIAAAVPRAAHAAGFPEPNFGEARRGAVTETETQALMVRFGPTEHPSAMATDPARGSLASAVASPAGDTQRLYTAEEVASAIVAARKLEAGSPKTAAASASGRRGKSRKASNGALLASASTTSVAESPPVDPREARRRRMGEMPLSFFMDKGASDRARSSAAGESRPAQPERLAFAVGTRIPAVLDVGISSIRHGVVLARSSADVLSLSGRMVPAGTVFRGMSSSGSDRIFIDISRATVGGTAFVVQAIATVDNRIGLSAIVRKKALEDRAQSRLADGAIEALKGVASAVGGPLGEGVARGTDGALSEAQQDLAVDRSVVLEATAGTRFEMVVTDG